jgi:hypothetical protein
MISTGSHWQARERWLVTALRGRMSGAPPIRYRFGCTFVRIVRAQYALTENGTQLIGEFGI